ncbi:MAG: ATP-binding protein [Clostridium sp.]|nr:ATP-binding protein [Bacteroides sp.]MCM1197279.1 ATP-binding protein [Clostridium sp.]
MDMTPISRKIFITATSFLLAMTALSAVNTYRRYDVRSGLSDSSVKDICQDSRGYMYFATKDGLNRFNGYDFQTFGSSSTGQTHNIEAICQHSDGVSIWMATTHGLSLFDPFLEEIRSLDMTGTGESPNCMYLQYDCRGDLWIASMDGVFRYRHETGAFSHYAVPTSSGDRTVRVVFEDSSYNIWACTTEGMSLYDESSDGFGQPAGIYPEGAAIGDNEITSVCKASGHKVLVGTQNGDFAEFDTISESFRVFSPFSADGERYSISRIHTIYICSQSDCLVGSDSGLFHFDSRTGLWSRADDELANESIYKFFMDREGSLWIGTYFCGVSYMSQKQNEIEWYYDNGQIGSLKGNAVSQFCEDEEGNLWIATENGGLNYLDTKTGKIADWSSRSHYNLHALCLDGDWLWIGTFSCGLDRMNISTGEVRRYKNVSSDPNSLCSDYVYSIFRPDDRHLYIGTLNGLCIFDKSTEKFERVPETGNHFINDIMADRDGNIWLADKNAGIWRKSSSDGSWKNWRHDELDPYSPVGDRITRVYVDSKDNVWFCEEGKGICRYMPQNDGFENFTVEDNLPSSIYYGILEDDTGYYWISSNSGIIRYNPVLKTSIRYTAEDGLQSNQFNFRSSHRSRSGMMYFGGINGFNSFSPFDLSVNMIRPNTVISSVNVYGSGSSQESSSRRIIPDGSVCLDHRTVTFGINFESLSFVAPGQNRYQWTMKGAYSDWITTDQHSVSFMKLPPGNYTFLVRGGNNDGYWSDRPASLSIRILPHPLLSPAAFAAYVLIVLVILYFIIRAIINIQKKKKEQELVCAKMTFFTQVAHEIKTPVSLIKAPLEKIIGNGRWDSDTVSNLDIMKKNVDRLQKLIRQLLDFRKIDQNGYTLSLDRTDIGQMLTDIVERFRPSNPSIYLSLELPASRVLCYIDAEAMTKVVSNLLANAFKYARSRIIVTLETVQERIVVCVKDDGQGIPTGMEERVFPGRSIR